MNKKYFNHAVRVEGTRAKLSSAFIKIPTRPLRGYSSVHRRIKILIAGHLAADTTP